MKDCDAVKRYGRGETEMAAGETFVFLGLTGQFSDDDMERALTTFTVQSIGLDGKVTIIVRVTDNGMMNEVRNEYSMHSEDEQRVSYTDLLEMLSDEVILRIPAT